MIHTYSQQGKGPVYRKHLAVQENDSTQSEVPTISFSAAPQILTSSFAQPGAGCGRVGDAMRDARRD